MIANSVLVLGIAFLAGGAPQRDAEVRLAARTDDRDADRARGRDPGAADARARVSRRPRPPHEKTLSLICAGVLIVLFFLTLPYFLKGGEGAAVEPPRWTLATTVVVLGVGRHRRCVRERLVRDCADGRRRRRSA